MILLKPAALIWGWMAVPIVIVYLWRFCPCRQEVSAGFLWQRLLPCSGFWQLWRPLRHPFSLLLQLGILALLVLALARPVFDPPRRSVLIFAPSLGQFDEARQRLRKLVAEMEDGDEMAILLAHDGPQIAARMTSERQLLEAAIQEISPTRGRVDVNTALGLAHRCFVEGRGGEVIVLCDNPFPPGTTSSGECEAVSVSPTSVVDATVTHSGRILAKSPPGWMLAACLALILIALEWPLFQRRWTC